MDTWFAIDPNTGVKQEILSFSKADKTCPLDSSDVIFIGRTGMYFFKYCKVSERPCHTWMGK